MTEPEVRKHSPTGGRQSDVQHRSAQYSIVIISYHKNGVLCISARPLSPAGEPIQVAHIERELYRLNRVRPSAVIVIDLSPEVYRIVILKKDMDIPLTMRTRLRSRYAYSWSLQFFCQQECRNSSDGQHEDMFQTEHFVHNPDDTNLSITKPGDIRGGVKID